VDEQAFGVTPPPFVADELSKLADLHDKGVLTDSEFDEQKHRLLGSHQPTSDARVALEDHD
jgi:hypothetical protein